VDAGDGLPFVFAVWAARPGVIDEAVRGLLSRARSEGVRATDAIARDYAFRGRRDPALARDYLTKNIRYDLGPDELRAMERFFRHAARLGCIDAVPSIRLALAGSLS
jgi:cyclic dehypoxanthinyl futalosine synthase